MDQNNSINKSPNSFSFNFYQSIIQDLTQDTATPDLGVSLADIGSPILPAPNHIPGPQTPIRKEIPKTQHSVGLLSPLIYAAGRIY